VRQGVLLLLGDDPVRASLIVRPTCAEAGDEAEMAMLRDRLICMADELRTGGGGAGPGQPDGWTVIEYAMGQTPPVGEDA
jgi:hypothetical protein